MQERKRGGGGSWPRGEVVVGGGRGVLPAWLAGWRAQPWQDSVGRDEDAKRPNLLDSRASGSRPSTAPTPPPSRWHRPSPPPHPDSPARTRTHLQYTHRNTSQCCHRHHALTRIDTKQTLNASESHQRPFSASSVIGSPLVLGVSCSSACLCPSVWIWVFQRVHLCVCVARQREQQQQLIALS